MIELERLIALALDELGGEELDQVELHVVSCTACARTLEHLVQLGAAASELVGAGKLRSFLSPRLTARLDALGLITRRYRLSPAEAVPCTVSSNDVYVLTELEADLSGLSRVDVLFRSPAGELRLGDVPFVASSGLVAYVSSAEALRRLPSMRLEIELRAVDRERERTLTSYVLNHDAGRQ